MKRVALTAIALVALGCGGSHPTNPDATRGLTPIVALPDWVVSTPTAEGIDPARIEDAVFRIRQGNYGSVDSLLIARNDKLVVEEYFGGMIADRAHTMQSVTKSVTALLVGIAARLGKLSTSDLISRFFPSYEPLANDDPRKRAMTIADLMTMRSGFDWDESNYAGSPLERLNTCGCDWLRFVLDYRMRDEPGARFEYISGNTILLGGIVGSATGSRLDRFAAAQLFGPLGVVGESWAQGNPDGLPHAGGGLYMRPRDMVKIGQLVLDAGRWNAQPIVDASWVQLTTSRVSRGVRSWAGQSADYGYGWWLFTYRGSDVIAASGALGQWIFIVPSMRLVVAATGNNDNGQFAAPLEILFSSILPSMPN